MAEKRQFLRIAKNLCATFVALFAFAIAPARATTVSCDNLFDNTGFPKTGTFSYNGIAVGSSIKLEEGVTYTLSYDIDTNVSTPYMVGIGCGNGGYEKDIKQVYDVTTTNGRVSVTFTPKANDLSYGDIFVFRPIWAVYESGQYTYSISNVQLEKGSTATAYQPYNPLCATCQGIVRSGKWNQLMNGTKIASWTSWSETISNRVDNTVDNSVSFNFSGGNVWNIANNYSEGFTVSGHKYYVTTLVTSSEPIGKFYLAYKTAANGGSTSGFVNVALQANTQTRVSGIATGTGRGLGFEFRLENPGSMTVKDFQIFDLTEMFGAGNEPATVAAAETAIAQRADELGITANNGYYAYYAGGDYSYCAGAIKIATTAYNDAQFAPVEQALESAVTTIKDVVANTIVQADAIQNLQDAKQTRPDEECPRFRQCLLIETDDGTPQWFPIIDPFKDFITPILANNANITQVDTQRRYYGDQQLCTALSGTDLAKCTNDTPGKDKETVAYNSVHGALHENEWGYEFKAADIGANPSTDNPNSDEGIVYGIGKCVSSAVQTTDVGFTVKLNQISSSYQSAIRGELERTYDYNNPAYGLDTYTRCWCKMTSIVYDDKMYETSVAPWVFLNNVTSGGFCAEYCALNCSTYFSNTGIFRQAMMNWAIQ